MKLNNTPPFAKRAIKSFEALKKLFPFAFIFLFLLSITINIYLVFKYKKNRTIVVKPQLVLQSQEIEAPAKVRTLMQLPQDEQPQVYTITASTPRSQTFVADAKNGDILLLYLKNQKAVLYDPLKDQILKVGPLTFSTSSGELKNEKDTK